MAAEGVARVDVTAKPRTATSTRDATLQMRHQGWEIDRLDRLGGRLGLDRTKTVKRSVDALDAALDGRRSPVTVRTVQSNDDARALAMEVRLLGAEVRTVGRNLNQVAKGVNSGDAVEVKRVAELSAAVGHLSAKLDDLVHETKTLGIE